MFGFMHCIILTFLNVSDNISFLVVLSQMSHLQTLHQPTVTMRTERKSNGDTMTSCPTSMTRPPPRLTSAPRAEAAETPFHPARSSPPNL